MTRSDREVLGMLLAAAGARLERDRFGVTTLVRWAGTPTGQLDLDLAAENRGGNISQVQPVAVSVSPCPTSALAAIEVTSPELSNARGNDSVPSPISGAVANVPGAEGKLNGRSN